ncbi:neuraminidase-like domain-containing protein [Streptomyces alboniger]|uniref:Tc toxin subunit A-related protein n=1 Tax=Streptomyces alboniger TaxID=132473 RepID=UPI0006E1F6BD|nr:neuraminidase-like domain-containing protein [Streptomyces alboniger]
MAGAAAAFLRARYTGSLRDIRRTYQRAFKSVLLAHRFGLSARPLPGDPQSELGHLLDHPDTFRGTTHPRTGPDTFGTHHAWFAPDLLPVDDPFRGPSPEQDARSAPSPRRQAALFDLWERLFDYAALRAETRAARERPAWRLFRAAVQRQPDDPAQLVRHLGIDIGHAPHVLTYFALPDDYAVRTEDLESEIWALRAWRAEVFLDTLVRRFRPRRIEEARPHRWAADDPAREPDAGNDNLTAFVRNGAFDAGEPRRYDDVRRLNDGLRVRARDALVTWLTGMNRVALPHGGFATRAQDLSDLLLQDVQAGPGERASRIEDAVSCVQAFVQRARLGLEPGLTVSAELAALWDARFATLHDWRRCTERDLHRENWIEWDELRRARRIEAFAFLESELRGAKLTVAVPGGLDRWPGDRPPRHDPFTPLQQAVPSTLRMLTPGPEGLDLLGIPEAAARPAWLAPTGRPAPTPGPDLREGEPKASGSEDEESGDPGPGEGDLVRLPLWIQAAIQPGTRFVRVAAAGVPPADARPDACAPDTGTCCRACGHVHEPLVDEYYFWLQDAVEHRPVVQNADTGRDADDTSDWHDPERLPGLLDWRPVPVVHLYWTRVHRGAFQPPRRSTEAVAVDGPTARLVFQGRAADSLRFEVTGATARTGHLDPTLPGFRYDLATDSATALPLVAVPPAAEPGAFPGGLTAYPYFAYVCPGAPVEPLSPFSVALTVAGALETRCRFESALKWYELVSAPLASDNTWSRCDHHPHPDAGERPGGPATPCCPTAAADDEQARRRAVLLRWLETTLAWGDRLAARGDPESLRRAGVVHGTAARILGERPTTIRAVDAGTPCTVAEFTAAPGPLNPRLLSLYDRLSDRAALSRTSAGPARLPGGTHGADLSYFGDDPRRDGRFALTDGACACGGCADGLAGAGDTYRFDILIAKANELVGEVRGLGGALLAAYEKGDAEYLAALRATQERQLHELAVVDRQYAWREADWQVQALGKTKEGAQARLRYHQSLIADGLIGGEIGYESLTGVSMASRAAGNVSEAIAQGVGLVPDFWIGVAGIAGTPLQFNQLPLGNKLASGFSTAARILNTVGDISGTGANLSLTLAGWERRLDEWRHQVTVISIEIEQIERQILAAERRRDIVLRELNATRRQIEHAAQVQDFLRDKFTSHELYLHLQRETAGLYYRMFELAERAACRAQRAFRRERADATRTFVTRDSWENPREGLLAGERLALAVRRMEQAYLEEDRREYELTKHLSLRLDFPAAYLALRTSGHAELEVPEWLFDRDYPGHYLRRLKNVTLTVPCVTGPYSGVHCRLTLLSSRTRTDPRLTPVPLGCCRPGCSADGGCDCAGADDACRCCPPPEDRYTMRPSDPRMVRTYAATEAITTSMGQNDAGLFELNFRDNRYLPFEFAGAVGRWRIELPPETNAFDFDSLSDVILHLNYTAREGGEELRRAAAEATRCRLPGDGQRLLDVRRDLPEAWAGLSRRTTGRQGLALDLSPAMFPLVPARRVTRVDWLRVFVEAPGAAPGAALDLTFLPPQGSRLAPCERVPVHCVADGAWPGLFVGEVDLTGLASLAELTEGRPTRIGTLEFPVDPLRICDAFLLIGYGTQPRSRPPVP